MVTGSERAGVPGRDEQRVPDNPVGAHRACFHGPLDDVRGKSVRLADDSERPDIVNLPFQREHASSLVGSDDRIPGGEHLQVVRCIGKS